MADWKIIRGEVHCTPEEVDYEKTCLDRLENHFIDLVETKKVQCFSYLLSRRGKIFSHGYYGPRTASKDSPAYGPDNFRMIASITKMFTAVSLMMLAEQGKLFPNEPVAKYIPEFDNPQHKEIQLIHLLTHTSGMIQPDPGSQLEPYPIKWEDGSDNKNPPDFEAFVKSALQGPVLRKPGTEWMYCSRGFMILAEIIYRVSGMAYPDFVLENILKPLNMKDSYFSIPEKRSGDLCRTATEEVWSLERPSLPRECGFLLGGGGLYCSTMDLWRFGQMLINGGELDGIRVLGSHTVKMMRTNHLKGVPDHCWGANTSERSSGIGFSMYPNSLAPDSFGHEGFGRSKLVLDSEEEMVFAFTVPTDEVWLPETVIHPVNMAWAGLI